MLIPDLLQLMGHFPNNFDVKFKAVQMKRKKIQPPTQTKYIAVLHNTLDRVFNF